MVFSDEVGIGRALSELRYQDPKVQELSRCTYTPAMSTGAVRGRPGSVRRVGVLGGTFDPPHVGHLVTAIDVLEQIDLDVVLMVVANEPWQKVGSRTVTPAAIRLEMVQRAVEGIAGVEASDIEVVRGGPSYTVDTLDELARADPRVELHLILGADAASLLHTWHRPRDVAELCRVVVVDRPGTASALPDGFSGVVLEVPRLEVSSTDLRRRAAAGRSLRFLVADPVVSLIRELGLYREPG